MLVKGATDVADVYLPNVNNNTLSVCNGAYHPVGHNCDYYPGTLSLTQVNATHLGIGHPITMTS